MQPFEEIEKQYDKPDPWGFETNPHDALRKEIIIETLVTRYGSFDRALDIGCGEAWITKDLPAEERFGYELSKQAKARFPESVTAVERPAMEDYDLVMTTGTLYAHYDFKKMLRLIAHSSNHVILTCNIAAWEVPCLRDIDFVRSYLDAREVFSHQFPYREFHQQLRVFERLK